MNISGTGTFSSIQMKSQMDEVKAQRDEIKAQMDEAFATADTDNSNSVSVEEMSAALAAQGAEFNAEKLAQHFTEMDTDEDGQVSVAERDALLESMKDRMEGMPTGMPGETAGGPPGPRAAADTAPLFESLLQSLSEDQEQGSTEQLELNELIEKLQTEGYNQDNVDQAVNYIRELIPIVSTTA
ncbi:EF-hand domain-containing protein [Corallincola spongiicola]|uniref:EF-hand domain-containing protein n=1 Tax=Corallincola spongiicola TaxID=2520508 RepID=A0ABY1WLA4_9GAMM|nr:EF-hand domain-containing protein [Corallincola spongiicola]TAA41714.1 EF-hand domain-containing protein [Corallincola spongiicola]